MALYKEQLVERVSEKTDIARSDVARILNAALDEIGAALSKPDSAVVLTGFGTFRRVQRAARSVTALTGEKVNIPAHASVTFKTGALLKAAVNKQTRAK